MAVFRVERNTNYTTMSNYHLRDGNLSLKAKGLLSVFLSLPDEWHYSISGLMKITKEGRVCLTAVIWELEKTGYLVRRQIRHEDGKIGGVEYVIYEKPQAERTGCCGVQIVRRENGTSDRGSSAPSGQENLTLSGEKKDVRVTDSDRESDLQTVNAGSENQILINPAHPAPIPEGSTARKPTAQTPSMGIPMPSKPVPEKPSSVDPMSENPPGIMLPLLAPLLIVLGGGGGFAFYQYNKKKKETEELSIKFGKGLAEPFTAKDGTEYVRIMIPNQDPSDSTPWASFVLKASQVHDNKFGKGLWVKLPADAHITVSKRRCCSCPLRRQYTPRT